MSRSQRLITMLETNDPAEKIKIQKRIRLLKSFISDGGDGSADVKMWKEEIADLQKKLNKLTSK